ncbi:sensor histidine kinase [Pedobacter sp. ASV28]|uniref:sensor histidine kinase n=1 Tax=Pedobacter sp. ASV28 TaxID=2795123 RepID=UPI0018EDC787|nr:histidine kinase [Pedobacter sp. ASV28]
MKDHFSMEDASRAFTNKKLISFLIDKHYRYVRHAIMLLSLLLILFNAKSLNDYSGSYEQYSLLVYYAIIVFLVYVNIYLLVPVFFFKGMYLAYLTVLMVLLALVLSIMFSMMEKYFEPHRILERHPISLTRSIISGIVFFVPFVMVSTTIKLVQRWIKDNERISELKNITLRMELNGLKNQINPHFLFNMLNNVNTLVKINPQKASLVILKLSDFLRYQLYDNDEEYTSLTAELDFLSNFLNLEKIRRDDFTFDIDTNQGTRSILLPPNLFTTFVENAVKHSADATGGQSYVHLLIVADEQRLHFRCSNSIVSDEGLQPPLPKGGMGLANIKRRLELLYADNYHLTTETSTKEHIVNLIVPI